MIEVKGQSVLKVKFGRSALIIKHTEWFKYGKLKCCINIPNNTF